MDVMMQIEQVLDQRIRPELSAHGGNIESIGYENGIYRYRLSGQCCGCPSASLHTELLLKRELQTVLPDLTGVELQMVSQGTLDLAMEILARSRREYESGQLSR